MWKAHESDVMDHINLESLTCVAMGIFAMVASPNAVESLLLLLLLLVLSRLD